ncbi:MAG TPA: permease [Spirochaetia bacterium]|nr:permease [Spirochaetia bacterium]
MLQIKKWVADEAPVTSALPRQIDIRTYVLYPIVAAAALYFIIRYAIIPANLIFLQRLAITVLAVTVEAMPFLLIGSILSAVVHLYVSEETIARLVPRNPVIGVLAASLLGVVLPVCDCATVPIVRRLVAKRVPLHVAITFMLAVPMINPLVIFSTWFAFYQYPKYILYRIGFGLAAAIAVGLIMSFFDGQKQLRVIERLSDSHSSAHHHHHEPAHDFWGHIRAVAEHAGSDFYDIGRYFIVGVILSSIVQSVLPQNALYAIGHNPLASVVIMVAAAYVLSVCSQADAFIARTFMNQFSAGAIVAFLIFGPMIDMKNTLMLSTAFRKRFILLLVALIAAVSILSGYLLNVRLGA